MEKAKKPKASQAKNKEFGKCSKYVTFDCSDKESKEVDGKSKVLINREAIAKDLELAGYNLLVTSEVKMKADDIYSTYHNLWRIEESFKVNKALPGRALGLSAEANFHPRAFSHLLPGCALCAVITVQGTQK